jgi:anti-sigma regulatory factor (Ser/Thr protein kinase)
MGFGERAHLALFYDGDDEYLEGVSRFIEPALQAGDPVVAALPPARAALVRAELAVDMEILDMCELGRNPARIIPAVERILARSQAEGLHYIGEPIWAGRSAEEIREATKHEALINVAWPGALIRVLCPYDIAGLDSSTLADAERTHPRLVRRGEELDSPAYEGPVIPLGSDQPLAAAPADALELTFGVGELHAVRGLVSDHATSAGLTGPRVHDLVLAVNELATNTIRHGLGAGTLSLWRLPGRIVCQVRDGGYIRDPLAGRRLPIQGAAGGLGLWTVNQLCDLVEVRSSQGGTTVRVHAQLG